MEEITSSALKLFYCSQAVGLISVRLQSCERASVIRSYDGNMLMKKIYTTRAN